MLYEIAGRDRAAVNSAHHQCIAEVAHELQATGMSDDGVVEALEWKDKSGKPFLLCVQWRYPERMFDFLLEDAAMSAGHQAPVSGSNKKQSGMKIINPATQEIIQEIAEDSEAVITEKYRLLKKGQPAWAAKKVEERLAAIQRFYDLLELVEKTNWRKP